MLTTVLLLDTETTGTDDSAVCIEVAVVLYSVAHTSVLRSFSSLIRADGNPAFGVNRIDARLLATAPEPASVWQMVSRFATQADAIVAHGAEFDRRFVPVLASAGRAWICSMEDLLWPRAQKPGESLVKLALAHDVGVSAAHRAMADCDILARLLTRVAESGVEIGPFLERGLRPKGRFIVADRGYDPNRNELAKSLGFRWDGAEKIWHRTMAVEDAAKLPFQTRQVEGVAA